MYLLSVYFVPFKKKKYAAQKCSTKPDNTRRNPQVPDKAHEIQVKTFWWNDIGQNHANTINGQYRFTTYYEGLGHTFLSHFWWPRAPHIVPIKSFCAPFGVLGLGVCSVSGLSGSLASQKMEIVLLYLCQWLQIDIKYINIIITLCSSCIHVAWRPRYRTAIASWANFLFPLNQSIYT